MNAIMKKKLLNTNCVTKNSERKSAQPDTLRFYGLPLRPKASVQKAAFSKIFSLLRLAFPLRFAIMNTGRYPHLPAKNLPHVYKNARNRV